MSADPLGLVLASSPRLAAYDRFLAAERRARAGRDYLFLEQKPRFEPRREDIVIPLPGLSVRERSGAPQLVSASPAVEIAVPGTTRQKVQQVLDALDGERLLAEVAWNVDREALAAVLRAGFGRVLLAPAAVTALEARVSGAGIVRFVSSPYAVERAYWENMADVRDHFASRTDATATLDGFVRLLRELHVIALMGSTLERFYRPASPSADEGADPGHLWRAEARVVATPRGAVYLDGPRVLAPLVGGARFFGKLALALGDPEAAADARESRWGALQLARGEHDDAAKVWFFPPRPLDDDRLDAIRAALDRALGAAAAGDVPGTSRAAAQFHYRFVRAHPFRCANQSVAMNLVNEVLRRAGRGPIPHLALDHLALRLSEDAYTLAFERAVEAFGGAHESPAARLAALGLATRIALAFMDAVSAATDEAEADRLIAAGGDAARYALVAAPA